ncbi:hypothetical protein [Microbulbifer sp. TYP-18]|uniref:hypothetical protein n=1 Tax=Microbulbifer sp. TYP-18 TaxID=3230024 RepID=UPI0034C5C97D
MKLFLFLLVAVSSTAMAQNKSWVSAGGSTQIGDYSHKAALDSAKTNAHTRLIMLCGYKNHATVIEKTVEVTEKSCTKRETRGGHFKHHCKVTMISKCTKGTKSSGTVVNQL